MTRTFTALQTELAEAGVLTWQTMDHPAFTDRNYVSARDRRPAAESVRQTPAVKSDPLEVIDPADWEGASVPTRQWLIDSMIPCRQVTILSGDGGLGKTLLATQLGVATATACETLGLAPAAGRVLYVGAEDEADEFHRRIADILAGMGRTFADLAGQFRLVSLAERDAVLATPDKAGQMAPTPLFESLIGQIVEFAPALIVLDTSADLFGGDEIKRTQVRQFIAMLRAVAMRVDCAILLLSHPSMTGMQSGSGTSGSTAWNNSVRSRLYLTAESGEGADPDVRVLTTLKANYGKVGDKIRIRWHEGAFVRDDGATENPARSLLDKRDDELFLAILSKMNRQGQAASPNRSATFAPSLIAKHPDSKGAKKATLERAMHRLLDAGAIKIVTEGPASRQRQRLWITSEDYGAD